jgi:hypothetical protein
MSVTSRATRNPICDFFHSSGHNITFLSGFTADFNIDGLVEITPTNFVQYIQNYTNWDLLGKARTRLEAVIKRQINIRIHSRSTHEQPHASPDSRCDEISRRGQSDHLAQHPEAKFCDSSCRLVMHFLMILKPKIY